MKKIHNNLQNIKQLYKCYHCGWKGAINNMRIGKSYDYFDQLIQSNCCCPECKTFYLSISDWMKV